MNDTLLKLKTRLHVLMVGEEGQDLVEYALLLCLITLALVTGLSGIATDVNKVFNAIASGI